MEKAGKAVKYVKDLKDTQLRTLEAICVQNEIDHLNGISCIDKEV